MTFIEIVRKQGFESIDAYLESIKDLVDASSDIDNRTLETVRRFESASCAVFVLSA